MKKDALPGEVYTWLTDEIAEKLRAIGDPHRAKKRATVVKLAFAKANQQRLDDVFNEADTCARIIWYTKWKDDPTIAAAFEACYQRVLDWNDEQTAAMEAHYRRLRRQRTAEYAADAPGALKAVMQDTAQAGPARISAANALITWADPEAAGKAAPGASPNRGFNLIDYLSQLKDDELDTVLYNLETATGSAVAREIETEE